MGRKKREKNQEDELLKKNESGNSSNISNAQLNSSKECRDKLLKTYVSQSELERIKENLNKTHKKSLSDFIRSCIFNTINEPNAIGLDLSPVAQVDLSGVQESLNDLMAKIVELTKVNSMILNIKKQFPSSYDQLVNSQNFINIIYVKL